MADPSPKSDLPQGTLDLLILKIVAVQPVHGYAIAQRLQQISRDIVQVPGGIEPIVMGVENPTAGGYAKIGTVISADLGKMGQILPKGPLRFRQVTAAEGIAAIKHIWTRLQAASAALSV